MKQQARGRLTEARIGVLMGGWSSERDISLKTGRAVHQALVRLGYDAVPIEVGDRLLEDLNSHKIGIAFLALHGSGGEDGTMQGFLETVGIPYTGSGVLASAMGMNKIVTKTVLASSGIPVPPGSVVTRGAAVSLPTLLRKAKLRLPIVVKPASQGSTIGVTIVRRAAEWEKALATAHHYDEEAVVEAFIPGREVTVAVLKGTAGKLKVLPAVEIVAPDGFYDFAAKYQKGKTTYLCPAPLPARTVRTLEDLGHRVFSVLRCEGAARVDFRVTPEGRPYVLEINTVPGMTETSLLPMAAAKAGIDYERLVEWILQSALDRARRFGVTRTREQAVEG
ncbi:MAG: D-alanine--D-alanine ligase [Nitrospira sp.]|nr:D-alanine--D-alanine ligase [Nitrospira sp.]MCP9464283.1 D-alanine--D-alanine ligase [Nitrospira sp.]